MNRDILGLEISSNYIRYAYLKKERKKIFILKKGKFLSGAAFPLKDPAALTKAIQDILDREHISPSGICLTIPPEGVFINQINLPKMPDAQLNEILREEIQKIPRFSNEEFECLYSAFKLTEQGLRVLFSAVARDALDFCGQGVRAAGRHIESLEASPLHLLELLYSAGNRDKVEVLLVMVEKSSYLMIFWQNGCRFFFQMATGLVDLCPLTGKIDQGAYFNWIEEVKRILKSYSKDRAISMVNKEIERVWFVWDQEKTENLDRLVAQELGLEVIKPQLQDFGVELKEKEEGFNPIYFLSLAGPLIYLKGLKERFNFKEFIHKVTLRNIVKGVIFSVVTYIALTGLLSGIICARCASEANKLLKYDKEVSLRINSLEQQMVELRKERDDYLGTREKLLNQATFVRMLNRVSWSEIIDKVCSVLPENISLSSFEVIESGDVNVEAATFSIDSVAEFIRKISSVPFLEEAKFNFLKEIEAKGGKKIVEFCIYTKLKLNITDEKR